MKRHLVMSEVAERLGVSERTVETWLASDLTRSVDDRRFQFHVRHGRRRLWSEDRYLQLEAAVERESEPGGVIAGGRERIAPAPCRVLQFS